MVKRTFGILLCVLIWSFWVGPASAYTVQAVAGRDRIGVGETLQLQVRVDDIPDAEPDFTALQEDWEILNQSRNSQRRIVNGSYSSSMVYNLNLLPRGQGELIIPAICFEQECSAPLHIEVSPRSSLKTPIDQQVQFEAEISPQQTAVMGQLLLKVRLALRVGLPEGQISEPRPEGVHALVKPLGPGVINHERRSNGVLFQVLERRYLIFPQESGQLQIPPLHYDGVIVGGSSRFDPFAKQGMQVRLESDPLQVEVEPLPENLGGRPWLPATSVSLLDDWQQQPPQLVVGEPATRTLRLSAAGVFSEQLPELKPSVPAGFKSYLDPPTRQDHLQGDGVTGEMEQTISLVPTRPGRYQLPAFDLDWWDVSAGRWRTAHLDALELDVAPATGGALTSAPPVPVPEVQDVTTKETVPGFWPWLSLALAVGWLLTLLLLRKARRHKQRPEQGRGKEVPPVEKTARQAVIGAARKNDPQATRQALVDWSRTLWPKRPGRSYEHLYHSATSGMRQELEALDRTLYGDRSLPWNGQQLAECIAEWHQDPAAREVSKLPELYPDDSPEQ